MNHVMLFTLFAAGHLAALPLAAIICAAQSTCSF